LAKPKSVQVERDLRARWQNMRLRRQIENRASHHSPSHRLRSCNRCKQRPSFQSDPPL